MLKPNKRLFVSSITPALYSWTGRGVSSNLVPEPRSCVQSLSTTHFPLRVIPPSLVRNPYGGALLSTHKARVHSRSSHATVWGNVGLRIK
jgi:hypothetical protein